MQTADRHRGDLAGRTAAVRQPGLPTWLDALADISRAAMLPEPVEKLLDLVAATACRLIGYNFCDVLLPDDQLSALTIRGTHGLSADYVSRLNAAHPIPLSSELSATGPCSRAFHSRTACVVEETRHDLTLRSCGALADEQSYRSMVCVPLLAGDRALGTLNGYRAVPHRPDDAEVRQLTAIADQAAIALENIRLRGRARKAVSDLQQVGDARHDSHGLLQQAQASRRRLNAVALRAGGIQAVAEALAELVARPVLIDDATGTTIATAIHDGQSIDVPTGAARADLEQRLGAGMHDRSGLVEVQPCDGAVPGQVRITTSVTFGDERVARLWVTGSLNRLTEVDRQTIEHATAVCGLELLRERAAREVEWRLRGNLLTEMLGHAPDDPAPLRERAMYMGHDLSQPHVLLVARLDRPEAASPADAGDSHLPRLIGITRAVAYPGRRLLVTSSRHHVVLLWPQPDQRDPHEAARVIRADVARAIRGQTASIAITGTCIDPGQYPAAYRMARGMLQLALLQGRRNATLSLEDLGLYGLLLQLDDPGELLRFAERVLRPVRDYDDRHGTTLLQTLRTAVETGRDRGRTAAALHVHPNTVGIRIKRIESLLGRSLQSPSALLEVVAALMADDVSRSRYATRW